MAGYAKLFRRIWSDPDFCALDDGPQRLYMLLISQPDLSSCGVLALRPRRWATLAANTDADSVDRSLDVLRAAGFVLIDTAAEELAVRTYIQHDEGWRTPNIRKAIDKALDEVLSPALRTHIARVLATLPETLDGRDSSSQQPASCKPPPSSQQRDGSDSPGGHSLRLCDEAAAAIEIFIAHKLATENVRNTTRYTTRLRTDLPIEHGEALARHLATHPDDDAEHIAMAVFNLRDIDIIGAAS